MDSVDAAKKWNHMLERNGCIVLDEHDDREFIETIRAALKQRKAQGVDVEFIYDAIGEHIENSNKHQFAKLQWSHWAVKTIDYLHKQGYLTPTKQIDWEGLKKECMEYEGGQYESTELCCTAQDVAESVIDHIRKKVEGE